MKLATEAKLGEEFIDRLEDRMKLLEDLFDALGFCLSEKGDLLSQWRGYASDGEGVSIGFDKQYLKKAVAASTPDELFMLRKVAYKSTDHVKRVAEQFELIKQKIEAGALDTERGRRGLLDIRTEEVIREADAEQTTIQNELSDAIFAMLPHLYELKSKAFAEEKEWRLISSFTRDGSEKAEYRASGSRIIPYRVHHFINGEVPITNVILGPKNGTPIEVVTSMLKIAGWEGVRVRASDATYR